jgi:hypothetical protein
MRTALLASLAAAAALSCTAAFAQERMADRSQPTIVTTTTEQPSIYSVEPVRRTEGRLVVASNYGWDTPRVPRLLLIGVGF